VEQKEEEPPINHILCAPKSAIDSLENPIIKRLLERLLNDKKRDEEVLWPTITKNVNDNKSTNDS